MLRLRACSFALRPAGAERSSATHPFRSQYRRVSLCASQPMWHLPGCHVRCAGNALEVFRGWHRATDFHQHCRRRRSRFAHLLMREILTPS